MASNGLLGTLARFWEPNRFWSTPLQRRWKLADGPLLTGADVSSLQHTFLESRQRGDGNLSCKVFKLEYHSCVCMYMYIYIIYIASFMFLQLFWWSMWGGAGGKQHQWAECMYWCLSCGKPMAACTAALFGFDERQVGALSGGVKVVLSWDLPLCVCCYFFFVLAFPCQAARTKYCEPQLCNECMREPRWVPLVILCHLWNLSL